MKQFWVDIRPWNKEIATTAIESGADALVVDKADDVRRLGRITTIAPDGDLKIGTDVAECTITDKKSENAAAGIKDKKFVIVTTSDWTVIPLENLVAQSDRIIAKVRNLKEAELASPSWNGACPGSCSRQKTRPSCGQLHSWSRLRPGRSASSRSRSRRSRRSAWATGSAWIPARCSRTAKGMLMGNTSSAMLLVHAETLENPYVAPRPFRVNAGAVHAYILLPDGKTAYLSDLAIGGQVLVTDATGNSPPGHYRPDQDRAPPAAARRSRGRQRQRSA